MKLAGVVVGAWPCGTVVLLSELFGAESKSQVYGTLHTFLQENEDATSQIRKLHVHNLIIGMNVHLVFHNAGFLCYDDGCHFKKYACSPARRTCTPTAERLANLHIVVDELHFKGHVDSWCHQNCNSYAFEELNKVHVHVKYT